MKASTVTGYALATSAGSPPCAPPIGLRLLRPGRRFVGVSPLPMWNGTFSLAKALHPAVPGSTCMPRPGRGTGRRAERGPVSLGPASRGLHLSAPGYYFGVPEVIFKSCRTPRDCARPPSTQYTRMRRCA
eukprot:scaffold1324_cov117-Isochrysis_galbana.AAC.9